MQVFCFAVAPCSRVGIVQLRASPMKTSYLALSLLVAFAEGPRAQPSPRSITYVMRGNLCLSHRPAPRRPPAGPSPGHSSGWQVGEEARTGQLAPTEAPPPPAPARFFLSSGKA